MQPQCGLDNVANDLHRTPETLLPMTQADARQQRCNSSIGDHEPRRTVRPLRSAVEVGSLPRLRHGRAAHGDPQASSSAMMGANRADGAVTALTRRLVRTPNFALTVRSNLRNAAPSSLGTGRHRPSRQEPRSPSTPRVEACGRAVVACPTTSRKRPTNQPGTRAGHGGQFHPVGPTSLALSLAPSGLTACQGVHRSPVPRTGQPGPVPFRRSGGRCRAEASRGRPSAPRDRSR
jgi:hypothetical protein